MTVHLAPGGGNFRWAPWLSGRTCLAVSEVKSKRKATHGINRQKKRTNNTGRAKAKVLPAGRFRFDSTMEGSDFFVVLPYETFLDAVWPNCQYPTGLNGYFNSVQL